MRYKVLKCFALSNSGVQNLMKPNYTDVGEIYNFIEKTKYGVLVLKKGDKTIHVHEYNVGYLVAPYINRSSKIWNELNA